MASEITPSETMDSYDWIGENMIPTPTFKSLQEKIAPEALPYAIAAVLAPEELPIQLVDSGYDSAARVYLHEFFSSLDTWDPDRVTLSRHSLLALDKLADEVNILAKQYFERKMVDFHGVFLASSLSMVTRAERARIQRGFFVYELYCRSFPLDPHHVLEKSAMHPQQQGDWFVSRLDQWVLEEMSCIYWYFFYRLDTFISECEEHVYEMAMTAHRLQSGNVDGPFANERMVEFSSWEDEFSVYRIPGKEDQFENLSSLVTLGVTFMNQIMFGDKEQSKHLIRTRKFQDRAFLPEAVDFVQKRPDLIAKFRIAMMGRNIPELGNLGETQFEDPGAPNLGYRMLEVRWQPSTYCDLLSDKPARLAQRLGYVFWDATRLRHPDIFDRITRALEQDQTTIDDGDTWMLPSVEVRLQEEDCYSLPESVMNKIKQQYGDVEEGFDFVRFRGDVQNPDYSKVMKRS